MPVMAMRGIACLIDKSRGRTKANALPRCVLSISLIKKIVFCMKNSLGWQMYDDEHQKQAAAAAAATTTTTAPV